MTSSKGTIRVNLFKSKTLSNGEHPLMLVITMNGKRKYQSIGISCRLEDWDNKKGELKKSHPSKLIYESIIAKILKKYRDAQLNFINDEKDFTSDILISKVENPQQKTSDDKTTPTT